MQYRDNYPEPQVFSQTSAVIETLHLSTLLCHHHVYHRRENPCGRSCREPHHGPELGLWFSTKSRGEDPPLQPTSYLTVRGTHLNAPLRRYGGRMRFTLLLQ